MANFNRGARLPAEVPTRAEIHALLQACNRGPTGARNRAFLVLLWRAGLRTAEALALRPTDLDPAAGTVRVRRGKGGRPRTVGLDPEAFGVVDAWQAKRAELPGVGPAAPLLCTLAGQSLNTGYCRSMLKRVAHRAGIARRVHLHGLRHAHAVELVREGAPLPEVQAQLGHTSLAVTSRYLAHVTPEDLAARARSRAPWSTERPE